MPELPEVETVCRGLAPAMQGHIIIRADIFRPDMRIPFPKHFSKTVKAQRIENITRRAKYLLFHLSNQQVVIGHLGMSGRMLIVDSAQYELQKHDHVRWDLDTGYSFVFCDPRRFGLMTLCDETELQNHSLLAHLAPEPLGNHFNAGYLASVLKGKKANIKSVLMNQKYVVGVGNIYACEVLYACNISPQRAAENCIDNVEELVFQIRKTLNAAIASGGSTLRDYVRSSGDAGYFQHEFRVYGRENQSCPICKNNIARHVQNARSTFFCPECQSN